MAKYIVIGKEYEEYGIRSEQYSVIQELSDLKMAEILVDGIRKTPIDDYSKMRVGDKEYSDVDILMMEDE